MADEFWDALLALEVWCSGCVKMTKHRPSPLKTLSPYREFERFDCTVCNNSWCLIKGTEVIQQPSGWKHEVNFGQHFNVVSDQDW